MPKTIIIGETHWDYISRNLVRVNLGTLQELGYSAFGFEIDQDKSLSDQIKILETEIKKLDARIKADPRLPPFKTQLELDSFKREHIRGYFSDEELLRLYKAVKKFKFIYFGLDVSLGNRFNLSNEEINKVTQAGIDMIDERNTNMVKLILNQHMNGVASINIIGSAHMPEVQRKIIEEMGLERAKEEFMYMGPLSENPEGALIQRDYFATCPIPCFLLERTDIENSFKFLIDTQPSPSMESNSDDLEPSREDCCQKLASLLGLNRFFNHRTLNARPIESEALPDSPMQELKKKR